MKVTDIQVQKNNSQRVSVFVDGKYSFSLDGVDAVVMGIKIGRELTDGDIEDCLFKSQYAKAKDKAIGIISQKSVSRKMLEDLLLKKGYDGIVIEKVCEELEELGYIDDYAYASLFAEYAYEKVWGERKIRYELSLRGIDAYTAEDVLGSAKKISAEELAEHIMSKYSRNDLSDIKSKQKIQRYFASRGFDFGIINSAINICIEKD